MLNLICPQPYGLLPVHLRTLIILLQMSSESKKKEIRVFYGSTKGSLLRGGKGDSTGFSRGRAWPRCEGAGAAGRRYRRRRRPVHGRPKAEVRLAAEGSRCRQVHPSFGIHFDNARAGRRRGRRNVRRSAHASGKDGAESRRRVRRRNPVQSARRAGVSANAGTSAGGVAETGQAPRRENVFSKAVRRTWKSNVREFLCGVFSSLRRNPSVAYRTSVSFGFLALRAFEALRRARIEEGRFALMESAFLPCRDG